MTDITIIRSASLYLYLLHALSSIDTRLAHIDIHLDCL